MFNNFKQSMDCSNRVCKIIIIINDDFKSHQCYLHNIIGVPQSSVLTVIIDSIVETFCLLVTKIFTKVNNQRSFTFEEL